MMEKLRRKTHQHCTVPVLRRLLTKKVNFNYSFCFEKLLHGRWNKDRERYTGVIWECVHVEGEDREIRKETEGSSGERTFLKQTWHGMLVTSDQKILKISARVGSRLQPSSSEE